MSTVLEARGLTKSFAGRTVLDAVDLDIRGGEVHGLVGQNGCGKSTLIKILAGYHQPDAGGELTLRGDPVSLPLTATRALDSGLSFVHQDLGLIDSATVLENLRIGRLETQFGGRVSWRKERQRTAASLRQFEMTHITPDSVVSGLSDVDRAMIVILRAVEQVSEVDQGILILDEPTAYLPRDSTQRLYDAISKTASLGHGVLFVSHKLEEVLAVTDRVTVLRDGRLCAHHDTAALTEDSLIASILGFSLGALYPERHVPAGERVLSIAGVSGANVNEFSCDVSRGEILGLTGLFGMGHDDVPYLLFGATPGSGAVTVRERTLELARLTPRAAIDAGLALLPRSRLRQGGCATASATENATLATLSKDFSRGRLRRSRERRRVARMVEQFEVRPPVTEQRFAEFSGGNQQKLLVAKWFETGPAVFVLHEPTHGVDVGSKKEIFRHIRDWADRGTAFVMVSTEYEDLAHLCDRVIVFRHGSVSAELHGATLTKDRIAEQCFRD